MMIAMEHQRFYPHLLGLCKLVFFLGAVSVILSLSWDKQSELWRATALSGGGFAVFVATLGYIWVWLKQGKQTSGSELK